MTDPEKQIQHARQLAEAHWEFLERWLRLVYCDAFVHGYKHGQTTAKQAQDAPE